MPGLKQAIQTFFEGCKRIGEAHRQANYPRNPAPVWRLEELQKRWRIVREGSAHCFVCKTTGDVLKSASWSKPAKHARGNILDAHNGLLHMGPYGPAYLR
ncbi:hypothetical protein QA639_21180 [Bradyrhizobium pachyrhizi]|uniref:DUF7717 family protein n=1 Tax=Bradyrhizobium pachyrhizi TaxID=280333 RepID=UPI0024B186B8|nr:hypothetical protein [Bradyrhizobium pachyrhizi]WFU52223.1 hypothetical protein QA639_21180 [Bradyrhizobium pachyrhizi]